MSEENKDQSQQARSEAPSPTEAPELEQQSPEQEIQNLVEKLGEAQDAFLRAKAEAENTRRRAVEDISKAHKFAIEGFAENLLPVMDSLHAALLDNSADAAKIREGVELTLKQLQGALEKGRVMEINPAAGEKFDPHHHQAISMVPSEQEPNTVVVVLQRGYLIAERVLRPALVTVSQAA
jgi:molecular chaperone GrpE